MVKIPSDLILGIDPGTATTGYGLITKTGHKLEMFDYGCISTAADVPAPQRLTKIFKEMTTLIKKFKPKAIAIENIFFSKNVKTAISVAQARGVLMLAGAQAQIELFEYNPQQIKQAVTGYGHADKKQVQEMVKRLLGLVKIPKPDDAADALAVAICHLNSNLNHWKVKG